MKHLGDITKISGHTAPIVDCIIGGSPCQGLSNAGLRLGLDDERSGLYTEQVRIVKEMRAEDERNGRTGVDIRPRYMVWENVPGAFSSNNGEDFRIVLEELAKVKDKDAVIPMPDKWTNYGCIMGDGWSIAWRVLDAQFWGVPQRRRRIALVADFGGHSAPEILFVRKSLSGHIDESEPKRKEAPSNATGGIGADDRLGADQYNAVILGDTVITIGVNCGMSHGRQCVLEPVYPVENHPADSRVDIDESGKVQTLTSRMGTGGGNVPLVLALDRAAFNQGKNAQYDFEVSDKGINSPLVAKGPGAVCYWDGGQTAGTLTANNAGGNQRMPDKDNFNCVIQGINGDKAGTLDSSYYKGCGMRSGVERDVVAYSFDSLSSNSMKSSNPHSGCREVDVAKTLDTTNPDPSKNQGGIAVVAAIDCRNATEDIINGALQAGAHRSLNCNNIVRTRYIVRRLTPRECEALQGFPLGWTDIGEWTDSNGKKRQTSDAARYKALGNSIALPPWKWVLKRLCACYERDATMASLFDGIGGFPYLWEQINGKGTCLWASEIEEFPIAVTKVRIGE